MFQANSFKASQHFESKIIQAHGFEMRVPIQATHIAVDEDGLIKALACHNNDKPYPGTPLIHRWGVSRNLDADKVNPRNHITNVFVIGQLTYSGDWKESLVKLPD